MDLISVRLVGLPVALHARTVRHHEEVTRELALMTLRPGSAPARLLAIARELREGFAQFVGPAHTALESAAQRGEDHADVSYTVPMEVADAAAELAAILDEIDEHSRARRLLMLAAPAESVAYRRWFLGEFIAQAAGAAPTPWDAVQFLQRVQESTT